MPFSEIHCGILTDTLLKSELFGHAAGAFVRDTQEHVGLFERSNGGTVLLQELCDASPAIQLKLLHTLQEKEITRVGETKARRVNVRIIVTSDRDMRKAVREGQLISALYYRLQLAEIEIQPLRERAEDILPLARLFVQDVRKRLGLRSLRLDVSCLDYLLNYDWPGNVMELESTMERASTFATKRYVLPEHLPDGILHHHRQAMAEDISLTLAEVEKDHIDYILQQVDGNKKRAAELLGINTSTLWRKLNATSRASNSRA